MKEALLVVEVRYCKNGAPKLKNQWSELEATVIDIDERIAICRPKMRGPPMKVAHNYIAFLQDV